MQCNIHGYVLISVSTPKTTNKCALAWLEPSIESNMLHLEAGNRHVWRCNVLLVVIYVTCSLFLE